MKKKQMITEFDKIYMAKYIEIIGKSQMSKDLHTSTKNIEEILEELKRSGLFGIYKNISEDEWAELEKKTNQAILNKYIPKVEANNKKIFGELLEIFEVDIIETIMKFPLYNYKEWDFKFDYFKEEDYQNEEWKQIGKFNYLISNYGRIKNKTTKKLKTLRNNVFGYQVNLWNNGKATMATISRLVAHYFIRPVAENERVIHKDGKIKNNYYKNLEIVSK